MTDGVNATPGASEITPPPATRAALMADPAFNERVKNGDAKAFEQFNEAWRIEHGMPAKPQPAVNEIDVLTQMAGGELARTESQAEDLRALGFTETAIFEHLNRRPIPLAEHQDAQRRLASLKANKEFLQRLRDKDPNALRDYRLAHIHISMPVVANSTDGQLQPEIAAWERAHAERKPK